MGKDRPVLQGRQGQCNRCLTGRHTELVSGSQVAMHASSDFMRFWGTTGICIIGFWGVIAFTLIPTPGLPSNGYGPNAARLIL